MPIYEYCCEACGHKEDHLQKISEPTLTKCPACGKKKYRKQLTAAGFQLKGSGWYASDFKGGGKKPDEAKSETKAETKAEATGEAKAETKAEAKSESKPEKKKPATTTN
jgi:putative FmdB family regulatory protein